VKFIDEAIITVQSGNGGRGCVSFRRERFIERGGPDGGDGGCGGSVILKTVAGKRTLQEFRRQKHIGAKNGRPGEGSLRNGSKGADIYLELPPGTVVVNVETGETIHDFVEIGETFVLVEGGIGGRGNKKFSTSRNRAPKFAQPGEPGESFEIKLELKLLADIGIIGFPNAGKSTLISVISSARPKTASYPFTTLTPNIGMVQYKWGEPFAVADIPGLVEGAHSGTGLGIQFLKHVERNKFLLHLIDASQIDPDDPLKSYNELNRELFLYSEKLAEKDQLIVLNKLDIPGTTELADIFQAALPEKEIFRISAVTKKEVDKLIAMFHMLHLHGGVFSRCLQFIQVLHQLGDVCFDLCPDPGHQRRIPEQNITVVLPEEGPLC
jgi:GTP-binding protein